MTLEKYQFYFEEANKIRKKPEIALAIEKQTKLSKDVQSKANKRYEIEDKLYELYFSISSNLEGDNIFSDEDLPEHEQTLRFIELWLKNDPKISILKGKLVNSNKYEEIGKLENEYAKALYEYFLALIKLDIAINDSREHLFSQDYKDKLKEFADKGVLLYFLETPDAPILCKEITVDDVLESFCFSDFISLKTLFYSFVSQDKPSPSMRRKIEDLISAIDCLECGQYRSAARTVFALLESEHKNCSSAMDNYFTLDKRVRKGKQRAEKIQQLLESLKEQTYFSKVWDIVNPLYRDILSSNAKSFIDRNSIIHGDYYSELLDITEKDVVKLLLLFINMRMISDHIQLYCEMLRESLKYAEIHVAQELKKERK